MVRPQQGLAVRAGPAGPGGGQSRAARRPAPPRKDQTCVETTDLDGQGDAAAIKEKRRVCEACNSADARALEKRARRKQKAGSSLCSKKLQLKSKLDHTWQRKSCRTGQT